jgi:hypothetical protein
VEVRPPVVLPLLLVVLLQHAQELAEVCGDARHEAVVLVGVLGGGRENAAKEIRSSVINIEAQHTLF